jgi:hypothetical protein
METEGVLTPEASEAEALFRRNQDTTLLLPDCSRVPAPL